MVPCLYVSYDSVYNDSVIARRKMKEGGGGGGGGILMTSMYMNHYSHFYLATKTQKIIRSKL